MVLGIFSEEMSIAEISAAIRAAQSRGDIHEVSRLHNMLVAQMAKLSFERLNSPIKKKKLREKSYGSKEPNRL